MNAISIVDQPKISHCSIPVSGSVGKEMQFRSLDFTEAIGLETSSYFHLL
jgi:hypothetical protein